MRAVLDRPERVAKRRVLVEARVAIGVREEAATVGREVRLEDEEHARVAVFASAIEEGALRVARLGVAEVEDDRESGAGAVAHVLAVERVVRA
jgi:hypothetical protein